MCIPRPSLEARIAQIKQEIISLGADLQPGILTQQYNVCGKAVCRCKADPPQRHGPYYQLSFTRKGKSTTHFVKPRDLQLVRQQVRNYRRLRRLVEQWIALGMQLARFRLRQERASHAVPSPKKRAKARIRQGKTSLSHYSRYRIAVREPPVSQGLTDFATETS